MFGLRWTSSRTSSSFRKGNVSVNPEYMLAAEEPIAPVMLKAKIPLSRFDAIAHELLNTKHVYLEDPGKTRRTGSAPVAEEIKN